MKRSLEVHQDPQAQVLAQPLAESAIDGGEQASERKVNKSSCSTGGWQQSGRAGPQFEGKGSTMPLRLVQKG
jgi:hypothetical protein